jgi:hypothetical protein
MSIQDLPVEILEQIASEIESPLDLCSFGASRKLRSIVFPNHAQLRIIRCPLLSSIWEKLSIHRSLAANVRVLEIQRATINWNHDFVDLPVVPAMFDEPGRPQAINEVNHAKRPSRLEADRVLVSALRHMTGLVSFQWSHTPSLINPDLEDDVWTTLINYCPNLREVDVLDDVGLGPGLGYEDAYRKPTHSPAVSDYGV